ncbi:MAG TPA: DsbA family oxidoreductase [Streptosporangiaceae bacterium]|nr:DsbA family oxidoreductase [Streptosporangiaceae bacterium]
MQIEIWSDVVCPWCYIGKRRLERALGEFEHADEVEVTWRSFQLNPDAPATAVPTLDYLAQRFGPQAQAMTARVAELGKGEGLNLDFASSLTVNTLEAHRMLHLAADLGIGDAAKERLLRAHFTEGADVSDHETLTKLMVEAGPLQASTVEARVREVLAGTEYADAVQADIDMARRLGANGVPFFVIDRKYGISGAQAPETFLHALRTAYAAEEAGAVQ